jgi:DNA-binding NarL/FixJ family response regulator
VAQDVRLLIVADNLLARAGLAALLDSFVQVVGQTAGGPRLAEDAAIYRPQALLVDLGWSPEALLNDLIPLVDSGLPVVALLAEDSAAGAALATLAGFERYGLLRRDTPPERLVPALLAVMQGWLVLEPRYHQALMQPAPAAPPAPEETLTRRELEVLQLLATGQTNKGIARSLGITDHTVKFHVNAIMTKLGAQSRTDAVIRATRAGLILL